MVGRRQSAADEQPVQIRPPARGGCGAVVEGQARPRAPRSAATTSAGPQRARAWRNQSTPSARSSRVGHQHDTDPGHGSTRRRRPLAPASRQEAAVDDRGRLQVPAAAHQMHAHGSGSVVVRPASRLSRADAPAGGRRADRRRRPGRSRPPWSSARAWPGCAPPPRWPGRARRSPCWSGTGCRGEPQHRRGVPQDTQAHVLLYRGLTVIEELLPGFRAELLAPGAVPYDSGRMPWLGEYGWLDTDQRRLRGPVGDPTADGGGDPGRGSPALPGVQHPRRRRPSPVCGRCGPTAGWPRSTHRTTTALRHEPSSWSTPPARSSRLSRWLPVLAATRRGGGRRAGRLRRPSLPRSGDPLPVRTGVMIFGSRRGRHRRARAAGRARTVADRRAPGSATGVRRGTRTASSSFLAELRDPAIADLVGCLEPVERRQHPSADRQPSPTAGIASATGRTGLLVVGDALCSFNPVYGQGITVAALQAEALGQAGSPRTARSTAALQRRMVAVTDMPWSIATTGDLRQPTCTSEPGPASTDQRRLGRDRLARLAAAGDPRATAALSATSTT